MLRKKCAEVVLRALSSWEVEGSSSLVQCNILFVQIFHIVVFMKRIFVDPLLKLLPRSHSVLRRGRSGYEITSPRSHSLTLSIILMSTFCFVTINESCIFLVSNH